jgi:hypothetical protein
MNNHGCAELRDKDDGQHRHYVMLDGMTESSASHNCTQHLTHCINLINTPAGTAALSAHVVPVLLPQLPVSNARALHPDKLASNSQLRQQDTSSAVQSQGAPRHLLQQHRAQAA